MKPYILRPNHLRWAGGCVALGTPIWIGILALSTGARLTGVVLVLLGAPAIWMLVYAKPMTLVVTERFLEFRSFGRSLVVPYERLNRVWLTHSDTSLLDFFAAGLRAAGTP